MCYTFEIILNDKFLVDMTTTKQKTLETRKKIYEDRSFGVTLKEISEKHGVSIMGAKIICDKFKTFSTMENLPKSGRPKATFIRMDRLIWRKFKIDSSKSSRQRREELDLNVSNRTVRRRLNTKGLRSYFGKKKPFISEKNKKARLVFAKLHFNEPLSIWENIVWSDESKFKLGNTKRTKRVWCFLNERFKSKNIVKTTKYVGGSLMVWACFSKKDVGNIVKIDGKMTGAVIDNKGWAISNTK